MTICGFCSIAINTRRPCVFCAVCKKAVHASCVSDSADLVHLLSSIKGLSWKCNDCLENCITVNQSEITEIVGNKVASALSAVNDDIASLKNDLIEISKMNFPVATTQHRYSDIVKNKTQPAVIIQPKNPDQSFSQTKSDIAKNIDPIHADIQFSRVRNIKNGGILIGCKDSEDSVKFRKMVEEKLSHSYQVRETHGISPRVRIVGLSEKYPEDQLADYIKKCNSGLFSTNSECKLIKVFPTKKNKNVLQAVLQLDSFSYERVIKAGNLFIGYDSCVVFDAVEIYRCYNCNDFHHSAKNCKKPISCPLCGQNHEVKQCTSKVFNCSNCLNLKNKHNIDVSTTHAVWDSEKCTAYIRARDKLKNDILVASQ